VYISLVTKIQVHIHLFLFHHRLLFYVEATCSRTRLFGKTHLLVLVFIVFPEPSSSENILFGILNVAGSLTNCIRCWKCPTEQEHHRQTVQTHAWRFQFPTEYFAFSMNTKHTRTKITSDLNLSHRNVSNGFFFLACDFQSDAHTIHTLRTLNNSGALECSIYMRAPLPVDGRQRRPSYGLIHAFPHTHGRSPTCRWPPSAAIIWSRTRLPAHSRVSPLQPHPLNTLSSATVHPKQ